MNSASHHRLMTSRTTKSRRWRSAAQLAVAETLETRVLLSSYAASAYFPLAGGNTWTYSGWLDVNSINNGVQNGVPGNGNFTITDAKTSSITTFNGATVTALTDNYAAPVFGNASPLDPFIAWFSYSATTGVSLNGLQGTGNGVEDASESTATATVIPAAPVQILTPTMTDGQVLTWNVPITVFSGNATIGNGTDSGNSTVEDTESVTTNDGTFQAVRVVLNQTDNFSGTIIGKDGISDNITESGNTTQTLWLVKDVGIVRQDVSGKMTYDGVSDEVHSGNATFTSSFLLNSYAQPNASIAGTIYADNNHTGVWQPGDGPVADVMVYLDTNGNGKLDAGETSVTTDANGNYFFGNLTAGSYTVREVAPGNYTQTLPSPAIGSINVSLSSGQVLTGQTFLDAPVTGGTEMAVYRLYSPVTLEHLYTTDPNEYNTLESYVGTWNGEGQVFYEYSAQATVSGVVGEPLYRLYDAPDKQHFWTVDYNEYNTLRQAPWNWNDEGVVGYVFPTAVAGSEPLYRMMAPQVHLWTTNVNEYDTLQSEGWTAEGIIGYVM